MASHINRRNFFRRSAILGGATALAPSLAGLTACSPAQTQTDAGGPRRIRRAERGFGGYGELITSETCPELLIPVGFNVVKLSTSRQPSRCDRGMEVPIAFDGMAAFATSRDTIRLIRNHEIQDLPPNATPIGPNPYDYLAGGGTTTVELRLERGGGTSSRSGHRIAPAGRAYRRPGDVIGVSLEREFVSLSGTHTNCAGGPTPWGSWLSCEETTVGTGKGLSRPHGYIFEVPNCANGPVDPIPLKGMGRFTHEAVAVDPRTGFVYETEDRNIVPDQDVPGSGFYRFIPDEPGNLIAGGRLQSLAVVNQPNYNTSTGQGVGATLPVKWVAIDDPDPADAEENPSSVFKQGLRNGAAIFQRLEGCWYGDGSIYFNATTGGDKGLGQVWQYRPSGDAGRQMDSDIAGTLTLIFESPGREYLEHPDNITVSPRGGVVLCEDSPEHQFLRGLTPLGEIFDLVRTAGESTEFAGATFSPGGEVLFFNIQGSTVQEMTAVGHTFAMWGPWEEGAL